MNMKYPQTLLLSACLILTAPTQGHTETWTQTAAGTYNWDDAANWGGISFPNSIGGTASISADFGGAQTINLNQAITLGTLTINDTGSSGDSSLSVAPGAAGSLTLQVASGNAAITNSSTVGSTVSAPLAINSPLSINSGATVGTSLVLSGSLSGSGNITKTGASGLNLTNSNNSAFSGNWTLSGNSTGSVLTLNADNNLGAVPGSPTTNISLTNTNGLTFTGTFTLHANRTIQLSGGATLALAPNATSTATVAGKITGNGGLIFTGNGGSVLTLANDTNDFTGSVSLVSGAEIVNASSITDANVASALGAGSSIGFGNGTFAGGGTLNYTGTGASSNRTLAVSSSATATATVALNNNGTGGLTFSSTANLITGNSSGARNITLGGSYAGSNTFSPVINANGTGAVNLIKSGGGTWILSNENNSYTGTTTITAGVLSVSALADGGTNSSLGAAANTAGTLVIANGGTLRYTGSGHSTNRLFTAGQNAAGSVVTLDASGSGTLSFTNSGALAYGTTNQTRTLIFTGSNSGANSFAPAIANNGSSSTSLTKSGGGKWILTGTNSYTGATSVNAGTLLVNGSLANTPVTVASGATFGGTGSVTGSVAVNSGGTLAPGASIESLGTGTVTLNSGSTLAIEINTDSGTLDLLDVTGNLTIGGGALLTLTDLGSDSPLNSTLTMIDYSGTWNGGLFTYGGNPLADDASFLVGANSYTINYNDGTAITLTVASVPEPSACLLLASGFSLLLRRRALS